MKTYLHVSVNWEQNNWTKLLPMAEFAYNNTKNTSIGHMSFKLNCGYHFYIFFEDEINPCLRSHSANKLAKELKDLILIYQQNLLYAQ